MDKYAKSQLNPSTVTSRELTDAEKSQIEPPPQRTSVMLNTLELLTGIVGGGYLIGHGLSALSISKKKT